MKNLTTALYLVGCLLLGLALALGISKYRQSGARQKGTPDSKLHGALPAIRGLTLAPDGLALSREAVAQTARDARAMGVTWVSVTVDWNRARSAELKPALASFVASAHQAGLKVALRVLMPTYVPEAGPAGAPAHPPVGPAAEGFGPIAAAAQAAGVDMLAVGYDRPFDDEDEAACRARIAAIRAVYKGKIAAVGYVETFPYMNWLDAVDYLGVAGPFPVSFQPAPSDAQLRIGYEAQVGNAMNLAQVFGRRVILFDVSHPATTDAANPAAVSLAAQTDESRQARCITAALIATKSEPWVAGLFLSPYATQPSTDNRALNHPAVLQAITEQWQKNPEKPAASKPAVASVPGDERPESEMERRDDAVTMPALTMPTDP